MSKREPIRNRDYGVSITAVQLTDRPKDHPHRDHWQVRIDVRDEYGEHYHAGRDPSQARAAALAAYHWHQFELVRTQGSRSPVWPTADAA